MREDLEQLVHLLLVLGHGKADIGILDGEGHLGGHRILVKRHGNRAQALRRAHRGVEAWPVVANDREVVAALEAL